MTDRMAQDFARITIDGGTCSMQEALQMFEPRNGEDQSDWKEAIHRTLLELSDPDRHLSTTTSGTTGPPKQLPIARGDLLNSARLTRSAFALAPGDRTLHCLPCDFTAGKMMLVRAFVLGLDMHFIDPQGGILDHLRSTDRFRFAAMVPMQLHRMLREDRACVERQFATILLGGGPVSDALIKELEGLRTEVVHSYGSTETVTHVALRSLNGPDRSDRFRAIDEVRFGRDPRGCLVVYTPHLSMGQHVTNDLVELLDDAHFRWLGRFDNVILSGGKKIFPEQLEARTADLLPYPHYFTSVHDDLLGQAVLIVVETDRSEQEAMPDIMQRLSPVLHPHEWPRRIRTVPRIERTSAGKMVRAAR